MEILLAFKDVMDGCRGPHEIQENTGLSLERCKEIYNLYTHIDALIKAEKDSDKKSEEVNCVLRLSRKNLQQTSDTNQNIQSESPPVPRQL